MRLIEDDEIYARVTVDADGSFKFRSVDRNYSFIAAGEEGFAAISFELSCGDEDSTVNRSREALASFLASTRRRDHRILSVPLMPR